MRNLMKWLMGIVLCVLLMSFSDAKAGIEGTCGDSLQWVLEDGVLIISGNGNMYSYTSFSVPWYDHRESIQKVQISEGVTSIGKKAFYECSSLIEVEYPTTLNDIWDYAFAGCSRLENITIPNNVTLIGHAAFWGTEPKSVTLPFVGESRTATDWHGTFGYIFGISSTQDGDSTFQYSSNASTYWFCIPKSIKSVTITDAQSLPSYAFYNCNWFSVNILSKVSKMGESVFVRSIGPSTLSFLDGITAIPKSAFFRCTGLVDLTIPESVTVISDYAFHGCCNVESAKLPDNLKTIGYSAFGECSKLKDIEFPSSLTTIPTCAFRNCTSFVNITIPDSVKNLGLSAFENCINLSKITVPGALRNVESSAFNGCSKLSAMNISGNLSISLSSVYPEIYLQIEQIHLMENVHGISASSLAECSNLARITVDPENEALIVVDDDLYDKDQKELIICLNKSAVYHVMDGIETIHAYAFLLCPTITTVTVPDTVNSIQDNAFNSKETTLITNCNTYAARWALTHAQSMMLIHQWDDPIYTWSEDHSSVSALRVCLKDSSHNERGTVNAKGVVSREPTCSTMGETTYTSDVFYNTAFTVQIVKVDDIDMLPHEWNEPVYHWNDDYSEVTGTRVCQQNPEHTETETVGTVSSEYIMPSCIIGGGILYTGSEFDNISFEAQSIFIEYPNEPALGHSLVNITAMEPTCTEEGRTEGSYCSRCEEVLVESTVIPAIGHAWDEPTYKWMAVTGNMIARRICKNNDEHVETEEAHMTIIVRSPTDHERGKYYYISDSFDNPAFTVQQKIGDIPALTDMNTITLPDQLTVIENEAFAGLKVNAVVIPEGCTRLGAGAFRFCNDLIYVKIPNSLKYIAEDAFDGCPNVVFDVCN